MEGYQPEQLDDDQLNALIDEAIAEVGGEADMKKMGQIMKAATAKAAGRADGKRLSTAVKSRLSN